MDSNCCNTFAAKQCTDEAIENEVAACFFNHIKPSSTGQESIEVIRETMKGSLYAVLRELPVGNRWRSEFKTCMETALMYATKCVCVGEAMNGCSTGDCPPPQAA